MCFSSSFYLPPPFLAIQGHYRVTKSSRVPISKPEKEKKKTSGWSPACPQRESSCSTLKSGAACPRRKVDLVVHKRTAIRPISAPQPFRTMLFMCKADKKQAKFSARQRSLQHGWGQANLTQQLSEQSPCLWSRMEGLPESWNIAARLLLVLFVFEQNR